MKRVLAILLVALSLGACSENLTGPSNGTIYGDLVYPDGKPAMGIVVVVEGTDLMGITDAHGRFVINEVPAVDEAGMGKYYTVRGYGTHDGTSVGFIREKFKVKGQQSYGLGVTEVLPTGTIFGAVMLEDADDHSGVEVRIEGTSLKATSKVGGRYMITDVPVHMGYKIRCSHEGYVSATVESVLMMGQEMPVSVTEGGMTNLGLSVLTKQN